MLVSSLNVCPPRRPVDIVNRCNYFHSLFGMPHTRDGQICTVVRTLKYALDRSTVRPSTGFSRTGNLLFQAVVGLSRHDWNRGSKKFPAHARNLRWAAA